jgi:hypothetical protein
MQVIGTLTLALTSVACVLQSAEPPVVRDILE